MERPFPAYKGDEPYIFVSYAHADDDIIYPEIQWLHDQGFNVWYDEGISPGEEWTEGLAQAIKGASHFLYFVTPDSIQSRNCRNEVNFALENDQHLVSVHLKKTQLTGGLRLSIGLTQAILKHELGQRNYEEKLLAALKPEAVDATVESRLPADSQVVENLEAGFTLVQWTVIPRQSVLRDDAGERRIEPKMMEVLVYLAEHAGDVVTRDELLDNVWSGMVVGDEALSRAVSLLRSHLDDDPRQPIFIQTIPRRGYRLIPTPQQVPSATAEALREALPEGPARQSNWWRYLAGAAVMLVLGIVIWRATVSIDTDPWLEAARTGRPINVAVFPLSTQGPIPDERAFVAESLADEIIVALSHIEDVRVARSSSRSVEELADSLDLDAIIEGSVRWQLDRALITLHLTSARDGYQIWSQSFESDLKDVFYVQDAISSAVVAELERSLGRKLRQRGPIRSSHIPDPEAYELFLRGRLLWQQHGETALLESIERFSEAIALDPNFARAHLKLAQAYMVLPPYSDEPETKMFGRAEVALARAEALDPALAAEVRGTHAHIASRRLRWIEAREDFQYAVEHAPENAEIHRWFSEFLLGVGHSALALEHAKIAHELDTLSPVINAQLAVAYMWADNQDAASRQWAIVDELGFRGIEEFAGFWRNYLYWLVRKGDAAGAKEALGRHQEQLGLPVTPILPLIDAFLDPQLRDPLAARRAVEEGVITNDLQLPMWILLDELDAAYTSFHVLEATPWDINFSFLFAPESDRFRADPRFEQHARHIGLDVYWKRYGGPK